MGFTMTVVIILVTALISFGAFSNQKMKYDFIFYPPAVRDGQWYRFITHGLIHADPIHLIFNMLALYSLGSVLEANFTSEVLFGRYGRIVYLLLYLTALIFASVPDYIKHRNNSYYQSLGASGAVAAVIFGTILLSPTAMLSFFFIPMPGFVFAILFLVISTVLARKGGDNIGHGAHISGAIYGLLFTYVAIELFTDFNLIQHLIETFRRY